MKAKMIIGIACALLLITGIVAIKVNYIDTSFATEVSIRFHHNNSAIDITVTDSDDIKVILRNLRGVSHKDMPSCPFSFDTSITITDGKNSLTFCPACDNCGQARIGDSNRYITIKDKKALEVVLGKYGFYFPCV